MDCKALVIWCGLLLSAAVGAAAQDTVPAAATNYLVGPSDVLLITSYDQTDLSGKFTVEADGTFTYPLIGRFRAGGLTLRAVEQGLKKQLVDEGFFRNPQITVAVETYKSQKVHILGEVRTPGSYTLSGNMTLVEALARAGSTLPTASEEAIVVHAPVDGGDGPRLPTDADPAEVIRVDLRELQAGAFSQNTALRDGDTIFVPRAESIYVFGQVKNPGAYALRQKNTTVLQALSLAGGTTDRGATGRVRITRIVNGETREIRVELTDLVQAGDTIVVPERFF
jgi:polysaccharide export outer membrane protein